MIKNIDLGYLLDKYDIIYNTQETEEIRRKDDIFKYPITISGVIRNSRCRNMGDYNNIEFDLYVCYLTDYNDKSLRCNYFYKKTYNNEGIEKKDIIYEFLKENENKKILLQGLLDFYIYTFDYKKEEYFKLLFNIKSVSYTRYNLLIKRLQKQINLNNKKDINWNNIKNIAVITDLSSDDAFIFKDNIDNRYNCLFFNLLINNKNIESNFQHILNLISSLNNEKHFDLIILLYNQIPLNELYNLDSFNILKMIYYFNIPFCSIISYENKHFNNEELVLSKITSFDFINYDYALQVFNEIIKNKYPN